MWEKALVQGRQVSVETVNDTPTALGALQVDQTKLKAVCG